MSKKSVRNHRITLYINSNSLKYCDSFGVNHIPKEIKKFTDNKFIITNIFRIHTYESILSGYFCIGYIDFMFKGKSLANLFSQHDFEKNDKVILNYFLN